MAGAAQTPSCWIISDGRRGIENQALGLGEAMADIRPLDLKIHKLSPGAVFRKFPVKWQFRLKSDPAAYAFKPPFPQIAIGCGRAAIPALLALKKKQGDKVFCIYIQDPRIDPGLFDLVIAPQHDELQGKNVLSILGSPNRVTQKKLENALLEFEARLSHLPPPRVAVLIGGNSKTHKLSREIHRAHTQLICGLAERRYSVLLTTSRRTPEWALKDYKMMSKDRRQVWIWDGNDKNPYFAFLAAADAILVTEDSTNMLTEACATGKPVFTLAMEGQSGKFQKLYDGLVKRCKVSPFLGSTEAPEYVPLDETARIAKIVWEKYANRPY